MIFESFANRLTIKAGYNILYIYKGEYTDLYHNIVLEVLESGQFDTISIYKVTNMTEQQLNEIKTKYPNIQINN